VLQYFDGTVGMVFVELSEEAVFCFYLVNLLLTLIFAGIHWSYGGGAVVFAMLAGLVLSIIFASASNLIAPIITHAAFEAFYFAGGVAFLWRLYSRAWWVDHRNGDFRNGSSSTKLGWPRHVRFTPIRDRIADIPDWQLRAIGRNLCVPKT
jgi:hypothetical protein